jgi:hypothetical protein
MQNDSLSTKRTVGADPLWRTLVALRKNAIELGGMHDLVMVYGWSVIRRGNEVLDQQLKDIERKWPPQ